MQGNELLMTKVKEWMEKNNAMKKLSKEMKVLREEKKELTKK